MIKDYITAQNADILQSSEEKFAEEHWSRLWREKPIDIKRSSESIKVREEFKIMHPYLCQLSESAKILDAGCGLGAWTIFFASQGYDTTGIDISRESICRLKEMKAPGIYFCSDVRKTPFEDDTFDLIFSWGVFEHFENGPEDCLSEAYRILKPGGLVFVSVPYENLRHVRRMTKAVKLTDEKSSETRTSASGCRFYQWRFSESELYQQTTIAGFHARKIRPIDKREGVRRILHGIFPTYRSQGIYDRIESLLCFLTPARWVCHMIMIVAQKPHTH